MRDPFIDVLKFLAMLMVVFGHVRAAFDVANGDPYVLNIIVGVNMPIFFSVSGMLFARTFQEGDCAKVGRNCLKYAYPTMVISLGYATAFFVFRDMSLKTAINCFFNSLVSYWFIWCLICCQMLTMGIKRYTVHWGVWMAVGFVILLFFRQYDFVNRFVNMWPYFIFGIMILNKKKVWLSWKVGLICLATFISFIALEGDVRANGMGFYWSRGVWQLLPRCLIGVSGTIGLMMIVSRCLRTFERLEVLSAFGCTTLGVYLIHMKLLPMLKLFDGMGGGAPIVICITLLLFLICHYITRFSVRCPTVNRYIWLTDWRR